MQTQATDKFTDRQAMAKLDEEVIELVSDEQLEAEVEESDLYRERAGLAIISLDDALKSFTLERTRETASPSRLSERSVDHL